MLVYAAASALLAAQIKRILDSRPAAQQKVGQVALADHRPLSAQGHRRVLLRLPDDRRRPARGPRPARPAARAHAGAVGGLLRATHDRAAALAADQRRRAGAARRLRDGGRSAAGRPRRRRLCAALLFYYDARLAHGLRDGGAHHRLSAGEARATAAQDQPAKPGSARAADARGRRGVHRPPDREGVRRRGARRREVPKASDELYRTNMRVTRIVSVLPPIMEMLGAFAIAGALYYGAHSIAAGRLHQRRVRGVRRRAAVHVRPDQEAEPRQRQPAAGHRRGRAHLRGARPPHGGPRAAWRRRPAAFPASPSSSATWCSPTTTRRGRFSRASAVTVSRGQVDGAGRAERRGQDDDDEPGAAVLRRHRRRHPDRRRRHPRRDAGLPARADRHRHAGDDPLRRHRQQQHRLRTSRRLRAPRSRRRRAPPTRTSSSRRSRRATRRRSASAGSGCRAASVSGSRSRVRC